MHPEYRRVASDGADGVEAALTPIYPLTEGVQQGRLRQLTSMALREVANETIRDWLPASTLRELNLPSLREALEYVHRPPPDASLELLSTYRHPSQRRLAFEEMLAHHLSLRLLRREVQRDPGWPFQPQRNLLEDSCARCRSRRPARSGVPGPRSNAIW